jgi:hypothetical protein
VSETAKRLMDLAKAHIRDAGYGGFSFRDLAAEIGIKSASCIIISPPRPRWLPLLPGVTETVSLPQSLGARMECRRCHLRSSIGLQGGSQSPWADVRDWHEREAE